MSQATSVYNALVDRIEALYASLRRLPNPYDLTENPEPLLKAGWGLVVGSAENTERHISQKLSVARTFTVVFVRKFYGKDSDTTPRETTEQAILEDQFTLIDDFETDSTLNGTASITKFVSDSGIQAVSFEKSQYVFIETNFTVEYFESL